MDITRKYAFLSYSRQDSAIADRVSAALASHGIQLWRDIEQIEPGSQWEQAIERGLTSAEAIIFLASPNANASAWIRHEITEFLAKGKPVYTLVIDERGQDSIPLALRSIQWIDVSRDFTTGIEKLVGALRRAGIAENYALPKETPRSKGYVFVSYAEEDAEFVDVLRPFLRQHGYGYWDYSESDRDYHGQYINELEKIIQSAEALLCVLSPSWKASKWTLREFLFSEEIGKPAILLRAKDMPPSLAIQGIPYIDFVQDTSAGIERLHRELQRKGL